MTDKPANDNTSPQHDKAKKDFESGGKSPKQSRDEQRISTPQTEKPGKPPKK